MPRFLNAVLLGAALITPLAMAPSALRAADQKTARTYHDKGHNDDHQWNSHEDQAYRMYAKENHRKYTNFSKLKDDDQQAYWGWRHEQALPYEVGRACGAISMSRNEGTTAEGNLGANRSYRKLKHRSTF